ncbi:hypothetical protein BDA96_10G038100 [Sorghum bicolor]|uniref:Uncharacterized protein n=1 Tax=Sorghum bicolor TaxID=4558 RepID=A0A921PXR0_SORBI|nr:hypothetical protein BDA96_10G038100 [Sorghum bicolor]KAG0512719.1 hypothetical protein BDA96_10G038100 [Sorghum bicolor]
MASAFQKAAEELYDLCMYHAGLFIVGLALTMAPQKALKPTTAITSHVKRRVPDAGLQGVATARVRALLRLNAALGCVLSAAASALSTAACTFPVQVKTVPSDAGALRGIYVTYVVIIYVMATVYYHTGRSILLAN